MIDPSDLEGGGVFFFERKIQKKKNNYYAFTCITFTNNKTDFLINLILNDFGHFLPKTKITFERCTQISK